MRAKLFIFSLMFLSFLCNLAIFNPQIINIDEEREDQSNEIKIIEFNNLKSSDHKDNPNKLYREYHLGAIPIPKDFGNLTGNSVLPDDIENAYIEVATLGNYCFVVLDVPWYERTAQLNSSSTQGLINSYIKGNGMKPVIQTNFWNATWNGTDVITMLEHPNWMPKNVLMDEPIFYNKWIEHCENLTKNEKPDYFILSKEVNDFWSNPANMESRNNTYSKFLKLCKNSTEAIHQVSPKTKVILEFRMYTVIELDQWDLVDQVNSTHCDVIGFTVYPYRHGDPVGTQYKSPEELPENYHTQLLEHTSLPIAITEIGWTTSNYTDLPDKNFTGSEIDQANYFNLLFEDLNQMPNIELVNWAFFHDLAPKGSETDGNQLLGMKHYNGTKKLVYNTWDLVSNRTWLNKTEVFFNVIEKDDYEYEISKSHAAMQWTLDAIAEDNTVHTIISTAIKDNDAEIDFDEEDLPDGDYTLRFTGGFEDVYTTWISEIEVSIEDDDDEDDDDDEEPPTTIFGYNLVLILGASLVINTLIIIKLRANRNYKK